MATAPRPAECSRAGGRAGLPAAGRSAAGSWTTKALSFALPTRGLNRRLREEAPVLPDAGLLGANKCERSPCGAGLEMGWARAGACGWAWRTPASTSAPLSSSSCTQGTAPTPHAKCSALRERYRAQPASHVRPRKAACAPPERWHGGSWRAYEAQAQLRARTCGRRRRKWPPSLHALHLSAPASCPCPPGDERGATISLEMIQRCQGAGWGWRGGQAPCGRSSTSAARSRGECPLPRFAPAPCTWSGIR